MAFVLRSTRNALRVPASPGICKQLSINTPRFLATNAYQNILVSKPDASVALVTLNRPKALNALSSSLMAELHQALVEIEEDNEVGAVVLTGANGVFAAGADIKEMKDKTFAEAYGKNFLQTWTAVSQLRKPLIAAVAGYALGGGCELAMMCDIILASPTARFGQPEINLGVIPGAGGTQRLTHAIGKSRAMEMVLTGSMLKADEAAASGLVSRVVGRGEGEGKEEGKEAVVREAVEMAKVIASKGRLAAQAGKEAVNSAYELSLQEGLRLERRLFHALFSTNDQKEGMGAFAEKRTAKFTHS